MKPLTHYYTSGGQIPVHMTVDYWLDDDEPEIEHVWIGGQDCFYVLAEAEMDAIRHDIEVYWAEQAVASQEARSEAFYEDLLLEQSR